MLSSVSSLSCFLTFIQLLLIHLIPGSEGLQCFNCRGITNYDPNECFNPVSGKTVMQECAKNEFCEKRVTMIDRLQDVIDRGCSANCQPGRPFYWTDEFQVYCCNDKSFCNSAIVLRPSMTVVFLLISLPLIFVLNKFV